MDKDIKYKKKMMESSLQSGNYWDSQLHLVLLFAALEWTVSPKLTIFVSFIFFFFFFFSSRQVHKQPFPAFYTCHHVKKKIQKIFNLSIFNVSPYRASILKDRKVPSIVSWNIVLFSLGKWNAKYIVNSLSLKSVMFWAFYPQDI